VNTFQQEILHWYGTHKRDLPWRHTTDPYHILVSEVMLQQTQVPRVIPIYQAFLARWPTVEALSRAELADVLRAWKGLGYNRRAKFLWELGRRLPSSTFPQTEVELQKLPGIGHYTAAAILAFSHNADAVPIDTNIRRIHHRYFGDASAERIASTLPSGKARDWNSALMDFGSLVCSKNPKCTECPLRETCIAYAKQDFSVPTVKQAPFKDSNRYYRGHILNALREGPKTKVQLLRIGEKTKIETALTSLEKETLVKREGNRYCI
jgi:A/G-specific adenine glycosylase